MTATDPNATAAGPEERCACGEHAAVIVAGEGWCVDCIPLEVARQLDEDRTYENWRKDR